MALFEDFTNQWHSKPNEDTNFQSDLGVKECKCAPRSNNENIGLGGY
jgi:hypothetical protein